MPKLPIKMPPQGKLIMWGVIIAAAIVLFLILSKKLKQAKADKVLSGIGSKAAGTSLSVQERQIIVDQIRKATKGLGTDELSLFQALRLIPTRAEFDEINRIYSSAYKQDIADLLKSELNKSEQQEAAAILSQLNYEIF